jgi:tagatose-1,6-bisphosphate aldolase
MAITNETFDYYRQEQSKIKNAIKLLRDSGYGVYKTNQYLGHKMIEEDKSKYCD